MPLLKTQVCKNRLLERDLKIIFSYDKVIGKFTDTPLETSDEEEIIEFISLDFTILLRYYSLLLYDYFQTKFEYGCWLF